MNYFLVLGGIDYEGEDQASARLFFDEASCDAYLLETLTEKGAHHAVDFYDYYMKVSLNEEGKVVDSKQFSYASQVQFRMEIGESVA